MDCYQILSLVISGAVCLAVIAQAIFAWHMRKFTKEQMQINRVNQWTAFMSADANFVSQVLSQSLETVKAAKQEGEDVSEELRELVETHQDWVRDVRQRLDEFKKHLPSLD